MFIPGPGVLPKLIRTEFRRFAPNGFHAASKKKKRKTAPNCPQSSGQQHISRGIFSSAQEGGPPLVTACLPRDHGRVKSRCLRIGGKPCPVL